MLDLISIFKFKKLKEDALKKSSFEYVNDYYFKEYYILDNSFKATIKLFNNGKYDFIVFDLETNEEYVLAKNVKASGKFIDTVHFEITKLFKDLINEYYVDDDYSLNQLDRIITYLKKTYDVYPEYLWDDSHDFAIFRVNGKKSWFMLLGKVSLKKLGLDSDEEVMFINLKDNPDNVIKYLNDGLAYPAYHMNKKNWYSLIIDGQIEDETIFKLIDKSYQIVKEK